MQSCLPPNRFDDRRPSVSPASRRAGGGSRRQTPVHVKRIPDLPVYSNILYFTITTRQ